MILAETMVESGIVEPLSSIDRDEILREARVTGLVSDGPEMAARLLPTSEV